MNVSVSRARVDDYLRRKNTGWATYQELGSGKCGIYEIEKGPEASFILIGRAWKSVLVYLLRLDASEEACVLLRAVERGATGKRKGKRRSTKAQNRWIA